MQKLMERTEEQGWGHHQRVPVRVYESDPVQNDRVKRAQGMLAKILDLLKQDDKLARPCSVLELGCGTGDISGPYSGDKNTRIVGIDCASQQIFKARERWPNGTWLLGPAEYHASGPWDVVVMCEFLEHVFKPLQMAARWLKNSHFAIISHPIDESINSQLSGGDHCWSFSEEDFKSWFDLGGHVLIDYTIFQMGAYKIALGWSRRKIEGEKA